MFQRMRKRQATIACRALCMYRIYEKFIVKPRRLGRERRLLGRAALAVRWRVGVAFTGRLRHQIGWCASHGEGHGHR